MISFDFEDDVAPQQQVVESPLKDWRLKFQAGSITKNDFIDFFQSESRKYFEFEYVSEADSTRQSWDKIASEISNLHKNQNIGFQGLIRCMFKEAGAKAGIIDVLLEFILGDNPQAVLDKLRSEGNTAAVCGKVFKNGEPTYSCRECGMDPTCVLCVNCFKQSAHRYHKYKMSTSGGGGCCDCGDEEAWKKDQYCEEHMRGKEAPADSTIITDAIKERCEIAFRAILMFCVNFLEIESNASLECLDGDGDGDDYFCTVLYNDESHTFDQVIQTLIKIVKCRQKDAMDIVASIDREGRAVVKCDTFYECCQLKEQIEKQSVTVAAAVTTNIRANQSLRVSVLHIRAISCQQFAIQLLSWFQEFLMRHSSFRKIFASVVMDKRAPYNIGHILEYDVKLWKTARTCWHRLLISGMLMEYDNKMALAQEFSRHYATVVQDFIRDDHEHSFSIVSLSVQLFTVPSIAHYLIAHEGIFYKLLHTFYHESIEKYIQNKTLHFAKNMSSLSLFKRAAYILYDLRYILSFKPYVWTDELREGFLEGCKVLLRLLNVMQGMESVQRQTGQHMDYEPEWECAFNLHIKLANTISLVLEWCSSDREVLVKLYQMVMRCMVNNGFILSTSKNEEQTVTGHMASCIMYDVASRPVSIHLPLSRLFAGIYLHLGTHGLTFDNAVTTAKRSPEEIMEPILSTQTMIAQVHSGMWRRNGYSLLHQLYFYRNVRCRSEMLDRDIVGLQIGAALIESNQYLIHILNKFNLIEWIQPNYEATNTTNTTDDDFIRQLSMIDEFLELLIVIIGERFVPGISNVIEEDRTRKEIIQLLCIKSYSHSELNRALPDSNNDTVLEDVIDMVAVFKKPSKSDTKGVYELKGELYDDYNMYFYHYTKEEKSKSEETQRNRRKNQGELVCCPPPKLPRLTDGFVSIANLLQCDVMMTIMSTVLERALDLKAKSFTENHLQKVLHLIGYGLQEEESQNYPFLSFYERSQKYNILPSLEKLSHSVRVEAHRDFILWTVKKFKEIQPKEKVILAMVSEEDAEIATTSTSAPPQPLTAAETERQEKEERSRLAAHRRAKIMAQIKNAQKNFMRTNAEMFASSTNAQVTTAATKTTTSDQSTNDLDMDWTTLAGEGAVAYTSVACLGVDRRLQQPEEQTYKCILCFEDCTVTKDGPCLVYSVFVQKSKVLPPEANNPASIHTSSCGHVMHVNCWQEYYNNEESKEQRRPHRSRPPYFPQTPSTDFLCPYCRCLSNTVLPLTAPLSKYSTPTVHHASDGVFPIDVWVDIMKIFGDELNKLRADIDPDMWFQEYAHWEDMIESSSIMDPMWGATEFTKMAQPIKRPEIPAQWESFVQHYIKAVRQYTPKLFDVNEPESLLWMWHSCIYTLQALEVYLRAIEKPFKDEMSIRHKSCLSGLIRAGCLYAGYMNRADVKNLVVPCGQMLDTIFKQKGASVLEWNCFSMLACMIFMAPNMFFAYSGKSIVANGSLMDFYTLQLFFLANVVKAIIMFKAGEENEKTDESATIATSMDVDVEGETCIEEAEAGKTATASGSSNEKLQANLALFYRKYNLHARRSALATTEANDEATSMPECSSKTIRQLLEYVKRESSEFLRCSCLFFHFVTDVEFPDEFAQPNSDTFANMCSYLGLNANIESYFDNEGPHATIIEMFASHPDIVYYDFAENTKRNGEALSLVPCTRPVPALVTLPDDYSDLINSVSDFICPNNEREEMKTPTMCLICGKILCGQSYCCQPELEPTRNVGACTYHANFCGAEIGLFLRIRDCQIVYLGRNKGCFIQPPYLDEYGETDQGLRRGNPLRLCEGRYRKIFLTWLGHGLHEEIARLNDNTSVAATQWHHM